MMPSLFSAHHAESMRCNKRAYKARDGKKASETESVLFALSRPMPSSVAA